MINQHEIAEFQKTEARYVELRDSIVARLDQGDAIESGQYTIRDAVTEAPDTSLGTLAQVFGERRTRWIVARLPTMKQHFLRVKKKPPRKPAFETTYMQPGVAKPEPRLRPMLSFEREDGTFD
jgi:hypothetical protein